MKVVFPQLPLSTPTPPLPLPVCPMLAAGCPGLASAVRSHFPSPQRVRHSLLSTPFSTTPLLGRGWLGKKEKEEGGGSWCECLLQRKLPPGLLLPLCAPSHLSLPRSAQHYPRLCVCSQPGEEVEPDGKRMGGWRRCDSWADSGPWGEEATDPGEAGEEQESWRWEKEIMLGIGLATELGTWRFWLF